MIRALLCVLDGHEWKKDPASEDYQYTYWDCVRCGNVTDNPFDVPLENR